MISSVVIFFVFINLLRSILSKTPLEMSINIQNLVLYLIAFFIVSMPEDEVILLTPILISIGLLSFWLRLRDFQKSRIKQ